MAQFLPTEFLGLPTSGLIISDILWTILLILLPILLQISWIFQNTPNFCNLMVLMGVMEKKTKNQTTENMPFWANPEIQPFLKMRFFNFFLNHMVQKYQNEISPIFYYGISAKTNEIDLKIPNIQPPDWKSPYWMSLYQASNIISIL